MLAVPRDFLLSVIVPSAMALSAIIIANGYNAIFAAPIVIAVSLFAGTYYSVMSRRRRKDTEIKELSSAIGLLGSRMKSAKIPLFSGMSEVAHRSNRDTAVSKAFLRLRERMHFGQDLKSAICSDSSLSREASDILKPIGYEYSKTGNILNPLRAAHDRLSREFLIKRERAIGSTQRYLVISMVLSTILPSLTVFAFVGYSILSYSESQFLLFSTVLLSVLPGASSIIRMRLNESNQ